MIAFAILSIFRPQDASQEKFYYTFYGSTHNIIELSILHTIKNLEAALYNKADAKNGAAGLASHQAPSPDFCLSSLWLTFLIVGNEWLR
jgi:hypothetical protein